jgi:N-acetylmuramoyl-L-alanine amidase
MKEIQEALTRAGFPLGKIDGQAGPLTRGAVRGFQTKHNLDVDGVVGNQTIGALISLGLLPKQGNNPGDTRTKRFINTVIWHCTATPRGQEHDVKSIRAMHVAQGWSDIGYHGLVHLDGTFEVGRPWSKIGAHVANHNEGSLGFSYVGGVVGKKGVDTRTDKQKKTIIRVTREVIASHKIKILGGHRDFSPDGDGDGVVEPSEWVKVCPCFDAAKELGYLLKDRS